MSQGALKNGITAKRLEPEQYADNFTDLHPPLSKHEAHVEADRCYFCYDAPCQDACPTEIDIPMFIREIAADNPMGAAKTIFDQNILGGMCARVCPTETLCEEACVRMEAEGKPVKIGQLQRFATDRALAANKQFYARADATGKRIAIIGAGPSGLACAHRLAVHGHDVTIFDGRSKAGGLNEYGIATYKTVDGFAQAEVDYVTAIGGIDIKLDNMLGRDIHLEQLTQDFDAVFLGIGLGGVNALRTSGEDSFGVQNAVDFISELRQTNDLSKVPVGRRVVVLGGGMTAVDAAVQAKLLGAEEVTICYRRGREHMNASDFEQELAAAKGVHIRHWVQPKRLIEEDGKITGIELEYTHLNNGKLEGLGATLALPADHVMKAIGQTLDTETVEGLQLEGGRIAVDSHGRTSNPKVWAGGDCVAGGDDLTVTAVAHGRDAAEAISAVLAK